MYIRLVNYMGDGQDYHDINLIGPYPDHATCLASARRLTALPAGVPGLTGGITFTPVVAPEFATHLERNATLIVAPFRVADATTHADVFNRVFDLPAAA